jgi:hypothetical protein
LTNITKHTLHHTVSGRLRKPSVWRW